MYRTWVFSDPGGLLHRLAQLVVFSSEMKNRTSEMIEFFFEIFVRGYVTGLFGPEGDLQIDGIARVKR